MNSSLGVHFPLRMFFFLIACFFLFLNNIPLCWCTVVCLSIRLLKDTWVASNLCVCLCVRERKREYELSCYKIHVHVFMWALAITSFGELTRSVIVRSCGMTVFSSVRDCFQSDYHFVILLTTNESSYCPSSLLVNAFSDFCIWPFR